MYVFGHYGKCPGICREPEYGRLGMTELLAEAMEQEGFEVDIIGIGYIRISTKNDGAWLDISIFMTEGGILIANYIAEDTPIFSVTLVPKGGYVEIIASKPVAPGTRGIAGSTYTGIIKGIKTGAEITRRHINGVAGATKEVVDTIYKKGEISAGIPDGIKVTAPLKDVVDAVGRGYIKGFAKE